MGEKMGDKVGEKLSLPEASIIGFMRNNPNVTKTELVKLVGLGKMSIDNYIAKPKQKGIVERMGSNKKRILESQHLNTIYQLDCWMLLWLHKTYIRYHL